jgi:hypothetical protein
LAIESSSGMLLIPSLAKAQAVLARSYAFNDVIRVRAEEAIAEHRGWCQNNNFDKDQDIFEIY